MNDTARRLTALGESTEQLEPEVKAQVNRIKSLLDSVGQKAEFLTWIENELSRGQVRRDDLDALPAKKVDQEEVTAGLDTVRPAAEH